MITEVKLVTVAVADLARSRGFYENAFDYVCLGEGVAEGPEYEALWNMPPGLRGRVAVLGPRGATSGLLRLVEFDLPGERIWGDYSSPQDYGHYALNIRVPEIQSAITRIREHGGHGKASPTHWTVTPELSAWDSQSYDPDGVVVDVFQLEAAGGSPLADYDGRCSALQTVALHTSDARQSARFYAALGFRPLYDKVVEGMEGFFGLPEGTALHNINMAMPDNTAVGRIEIAQYVGFPGVSQRDRAVPPNLGILSASIETADLQATAELLHSIGAEPMSEAVEVAMPGEPGPVRAQTYYGPDGEALEFFARR